MQVSDFDYNLPPELIAQYPAVQRDAARMMAVNRSSGEIVHTNFKSIPDYLQEGDLLVFNETRVFPARLFGKRVKTGGKLEALLLEEKEPGIWEALVRPGRHARQGEEVIFGDSLQAVIGEGTASGGRFIKFPTQDQQEFWEQVYKIGKVPLPPYIKRPAEEMDKDRYQTVYARSVGSAAAPTAGLHFTEEILEQLQDKGVQFAFVVLHVGLGTFRPVHAQKVEEHQMHAEFWRLDQANADLINKAKREGRRIIAVGTTSVRLLESVAAEDGTVQPGEGWTSIFIYPGFQFRVIDGLVTNFHLPCSTLLMLVSAFAGYNNVMSAYREAVEQEYRFFSYGDAMLIL
ncbi:MAG: tRNA preQ1(34) S-adenosylmethionine ribosyltransferase-isomerase QueA [Syntrophaceticus sp.]|nr:tRNA preQ1(34) S-adenosylmethionine ribosyltransferase-isomerase QueA [Syntrophaceticus sp.]MDD3314575.1 tRNA preQ1(34) S-adenosylmethionine ribosyltransferase-isomerase QueA [Syntrophaceticus sp.]MDD4359779.1 tRNA preQ1(34) S-adenosylmethionine ribosyltransferase-isomerase QueA [Syntrophaceticus sp.]MDD4782890.1 tRNA preQ1(34) S-adenosylmethionine ribosyltransferase-isomerase QueA [Syntrophaceticus sp.]